MAVTIALVLIVIGIIAWPPLRRAFFVLAGVILIAFLVSRYPFSRPSLRSYRLIFGLVSHDVLTTLRQSITQAVHDSRHFFNAHHL